MRRFSIHRIVHTLLAILILHLPIQSKAQQLINPDLRSLLDQIPELPGSLDELHRQFTLDTRYGVKLNDALLRNPHQQVLGWIKEIHDATIRAKISQNRRTDMTYDVQYDDERLKMLMRPTISASLRKRTSTASVSTRELVNQLTQFERSFDWQEYYKQYNTWSKEAMAKLAAWDSKNRELQDQIPMVQTEYGLQKDEKKEAALSKTMLAQKMQLHKELFEKHSAEWTSYFQNYRKQNLALQSLLEKIAYGQHLAAEEKKILLPAIADIQARGLEALERMIWQAMSLVMRGEQWYNENLIGNSYLQQ
jgi:hypothetical protein